VGHNNAEIENAAHIATQSRPASHRNQRPTSNGITGPLGPEYAVEVEQLLKPLGIILEPATDVDALQNLVIALMCMAQVLWHVVWVIEVGNRRREVRLPSQEDVFSTARKVQPCSSPSMSGEGKCSNQAYWSSGIESPTCRKRSQSRPSASAKHSPVLRFCEEASMDAANNKELILWI
jgi:hypothetical protein